MTQTRVCKWEGCGTILSEVANKKMRDGYCFIHRRKLGEKSIEDINKKKERIEFHKLQRSNLYKQLSKWDEDLRKIYHTKDGFKRGLWIVVQKWVKWDVRAGSFVYSIFVKTLKGGRRLELSEVVGKAKILDLLEK